MVVSALSGVTDGLISAAESASAKNENYSETIKLLKKTHLEFVKIYCQLQNKVLG